MLDIFPQLRRQLAAQSTRAEASALKPMTSRTASSFQICSAYVRSQRHRGGAELPQNYDDAGHTGANLERPALRRHGEDTGPGGRAVHGRSCSSVCSGWLVEPGPVRLLKFDVSWSAFAFTNAFSAVYSSF